MKVYVTDAALGHNQYAYLVRLKKSENGYDYLCIESNNDTYHVSEPVKDLEDMYVSELTEYDIKKCPLYSENVLFQAFVELNGLQEFLKKGYK